MSLSKILSTKYKTSEIFNKKFLTTKSFIKTEIKQEATKSKTK